MKVEIYTKCQKGNCVARVTKYEVRTFLFNHRIPYIQTENEKKRGNLSVAVKLKRDFKSYCLANNG